MIHDGLNLILSSGLIRVCSEAHCIGVALERLDTEIFCQDIAIDFPVDVHRSLFFDFEYFLQVNSFRILREDWVLAESFLLGPFLWRPVLGNYRAVLKYNRGAGFRALFLKPLIPTYGRRALIFGRWNFLNNNPLHGLTSFRLEILNGTNRSLNLAGDTNDYVFNICFVILNSIRGLLLRVWKLLRHNLQFLGGHVLNLLLDLLLQVRQHVYQILHLLLLINRFVCII